jgi:hypothetical protein
MSQLEHLSQTPRGNPENSKSISLLGESRTPYPWDNRCDEARSWSDDDECLGHAGAHVFLFYFSGRYQIGEVQARS